jgi:hypothetical protein
MPVPWLRIRNAPVLGFFYEKPGMRGMPHAWHNP